MNDATALAPRRSTTLSPRPVQDARTTFARVRPTQPQPAYRNFNPRSLPSTRSHMVAGAAPHICPQRILATIRSSKGTCARDHDQRRKRHTSQALGRRCPHPEHAHCHCISHGSHLEQQHHQLGSHQIVGSSTYQSTQTSGNLKIPQNEALDSARNQTLSGIGNCEPSGPQRNRRERADRDDRQHQTDLVFPFSDFSMGFLLFFY